MNIRFHWAKFRTHYRPACSSDSPELSIGQMLSNLLVDDGGVDLEMTIDCVDEGVQILESVLAGEVSHAEWDRETWGTNIDIDRVEIYTLLQEEYSVSVETAVVYRALVAWQEFLRNGPHGVDGSLNELDLDL